MTARGFEVRLAESVQARALLGRRRTAKTDRLDARWLARLLAKEMLPTSWIPPEAIQQLRDRTRLRKAIAEDRRRWGQRLHAHLLHEGWPCSKTRLLTPEGLRWVAALRLPEHARVQADSLLAVINALGAQLDTLDEELRRFARGDERCRALQTIYGVGPTLACHLLAEIGDVSRFHRGEQITRLAGLDPVVDESGETRRRGKLAKAVEIAVRATVRDRSSRGSSRSGSAASPASTRLVISLAAKGLTTGEIAAHFADVYGAEVSRDTISRITDRVLEEMAAWQHRPLDSVYPVILIDAIVVKIRDGQVARLSHSS